MEDRVVSAGQLVAGVLWTLAFGLWGAAWIVGNSNVGRLSLLICAAAATMTVRCFFTTQQRHIKNAMRVTATVRDLR